MCWFITFVSVMRQTQPKANYMNKKSISRVCERLDFSVDTASEEDERPIEQFSPNLIREVSVRRVERV